MATDPGQVVVLGALSQLVTELQHILDNASQSINDVGGLEFEETKIGMLWAAMSLYANTYKRLGCLTRSETENFIKKQFRCHEIQDKFEHLLEIEADWDGMLTKLDSDLNESLLTDRLTVGGTLPQVALVDARTGQEARLDAYRDGNSFHILVLIRHFA